ncbi:hypothetical protein EJ05DRAFT_483351 [Pseudovirgaria hyperparasitica]|uniref:Uncharacterized protein n=1 Tax=Pseudovirgaria hyperparasitica TaxID=470096 RepID=A0A6A6WDK9_9PEZI|nr:uncharacterized protein EJ05DRAFT_483351 [Pseudovirgaria hyperparasitica]KAF2760922.1 hypothetical protein EJ05DRAFT_483351 [Pseudovirgaria hyperparasitica]
MVHLHPILCSLLLVLGVIEAESCNAPSIADSQVLNSSSFIGSAASAHPLKPLFKFYPDASLMHTDGGNSGARDDQGPLGIDPHIRSSSAKVLMMVWGSDGSMTCGYANTTISSSAPKLGLVAMDPSTLQIQAAWYPPGNETLRFSYMEYIKETDDIVVSTYQGHVYVVHRGTCGTTPCFTTTRTISLAGAFLSGEQLLNAMYDTAGNIWFTTGGTINGGDAAQESFTFGYVTPNGTVVKEHVHGEFVENGIAVSGLDVYMVSGPTAMANASNATGYMYSVTSGREGAKIKWRAPYTAGLDADGDVRGSGSSPVLLQDNYVAITDRSSPQVKLNIFHQKTQNSTDKQVLCKVPLFTPGKSNNDNAVLGHFDGKTHGVIIQNNYGIPPVYQPEPDVPVDVNGKWNDMSGMAGGMTRIDINPNGTCSMRWTNTELAIKGVSIMSTRSGLIYGYVQDTERSPRGEYVWYVAAVDWDTGRTVYKVRTGAGGTYNDNYLQASVGPDGTFYQTVFGGIVGVRDGQ